MQSHTTPLPPIIALIPGLRSKEWRQNLTFKLPSMLFRHPSVMNHLRKKKDIFFCPKPRKPTQKEPLKIRLPRWKK